MNKKQPPSVLGSLGSLAGMGFTLAVPIAMCAIAGSFLDGYTQTRPLFVLLGLLLGLIVGIYGAYRQFKRFL